MDIPYRWYDLRTHSAIVAIDVSYFEVGDISLYAAMACCMQHAADTQVSLQQPSSRDLPRLREDKLSNLRVSMHCGVPESAAKNQQTTSSRAEWPRAGLGGVLTIVPLQPTDEEGLCVQTLRHEQETEKRSKPGDVVDFGHSLSLWVIEINDIAIGWLKNSDDAVHNRHRQEDHGSRLPRSLLFADFATDFSRAGQADSILVV